MTYASVLKSMIIYWMIILIVGGLLAACGSGDWEDESVEQNSPSLSATRLPTSLPPSSTDLPIDDAWELWTNGTRLRGVDFHPCAVYRDDGMCLTPTTSEDVQDVRNLGANLINASYPGVFTLEPPYEVDQAALDDLDNLVDWAEQSGLYVVIHFRGGPGRSETAIANTRQAVFDVWSDQAAHDAWEAMWRFTAERYRDRPVVIGYNLMVEPHVNTLIDPKGRREMVEVQAETKGTLMDWNAFAVDMTAAIREVDTRTPIIVSSLSWGNAEWFTVLEPTGDERTIYSFHAYDPGLYTHQLEVEDEVSYPSLVPYEGETVTFDRSWIESAFEPVREFSKKYDVPIFVGESGTMRWVPGVVEFHSDQTAIFEAYGWNYVYYAWRGDNEGWDGFNLEYGTDPTNHSSNIDNPLLAVYLDLWDLNTTYPSAP